MTNFYRAYLLGYGLLLGGALGGLGLAILHNLTGGRWGNAIRRRIDAAARTLPLVALLFLPIAFGARELYPWARPGAADDPLIAHKAAYLNLTAFYVRAAVYFALWIALAWLSSREKNPARAERIAAPGFLLWFLSVTFASFDWYMSLDPHWVSSIFGVRFVTGLLLTAFAVLIAGATREGRIAEDDLHDLGRLLFAVLVIWAYLTLCQFLIVWSANLPEEVPWYLRRLTGGWQWVAGGLGVLHAAICLTLLPRRNKRAARILAAAAVGVLVVRYLELVLLVVPEFSPARLGVHAWDLVVPLGLGAGWIAALNRGMGRWQRATT